MNWPLIGIYGKIYDPDAVGTTDWFSFGSKVDVSSTIYALSEDTGLSVDLIENTSQRVVLRAVGDFEDSSQSSLANESGSILWIHIYSDRILTKIEFNVSGSITLDDSDSNGLLFFDSVSENLTNENSRYENSGSESDAGSDGEKNSADYIATLSDECNVQGVLLDSSLGGGTASFGQYIDNPGGALRFRWNNGTITANSDITVVWVFDSASREQSVKIYNATDRLAMGDQYKDVILDQSPSKGDDVTDMILLHADGAHHYEIDANEELELTIDRIRIRPSIVIADWPFKSGAIGSLTDHLLCHLKCDENAASANLNDETSNNADGTWSNISDGSDRNTDTSGDSVQEIGRGRNLDTQAGSGYIEMAFGSGTVHDNDFFKKGSVLIKFKPQFVYTTTDLTCWSLWIDSSNYISLGYASGGDRFQTSYGLGGTVEYTNVTPTFLSNKNLQQPMTILVVWDSDIGEIFNFYNGKPFVWEANAGTPTTSHPTDFIVGCRNGRSNAMDMIIDEIKTFNDRIVPFGGFFVDMQNGFANPHAKVLAFAELDQTNGQPLDVGSGNITISGSPTLSTGVDEVSNSAYLVNADSEIVSFPASGNVDGSKGVIGFWYKNDSTPNAYGNFFAHDSVYNKFALRRQDDDYYFAFYYNEVGFATFVNSARNIYDGNWHWVTIEWWHHGTEATAIIKLDGLQSGTTSITKTVSELSLTSGNIEIGNTSTTASRACNGIIDKFYVVSDRHTPQSWTAWGKSIAVPRVETR
jgi:hypothetical protein